MRWWRFLPALAITFVLVFGAGIAAAQSGPADIRVDESKTQGSGFQSLKDFSSYGVSLGGMKIFGGSLGKKAVIRPILQGVFRYRFSDNWIGIAEGGFGWNAFNTGQDTVLTFTMGTLGAGRRISQFGGMDVHLTGGVGFYRWNYKVNGFSVRDHQTYRYYRGMDPGGYLGLEAERRFARHVTLTGALQQHNVFSSDTSKYKSLFDRNYPYLSARLGMNYHFSPAEGILWERKASHKIRLESGREGR
jgi:hypothetical protein